MVMDDMELQHRLKNAVSGAEPDSAQLWENVMEESAHARKMRNAKRTALTLTVLALAVAVPVSVGLLNSEPGEIAGPGGDPTPSPTQEPIPVLNRQFVDTQLNVMFDLPGGWRVTEFEGHRIAAPKDFMGRGEEMPPTSLQIAFGDLAPQQGRTSTTFAGLPAEEVAGETSHWVVVDWPASPLCPQCDEGPISVWWESRSGEWESAQPDFEVITDSIEPLFQEDGSIAEATGAEITTRRGKIAAGTEMSIDLATAIDFLDQRIWMSNDLDHLLTTEARGDYSEMTVGFESDKEPRLDVKEWMPTQFTILSADQVDANSSEIVAKITYEKWESFDSAANITEKERMFIGQGTSVSGRTGSVIRGAMDDIGAEPKGSCSLDPNTGARTCS